MTFGILLLSILFVYLFAKVFNEEYTQLLFILSVLLPLILTPLVVVLIIKFTKHLRYYKKHLEDEIRKNKEKDLLLYEQARFVVMGEMLANISHQWKQPLNNIDLVILSVKFSQEKSLKEVEKAFDIIESNVEYLAQTVNDFLSFFDKRSYQELHSLESITQEITTISASQLQTYKIDLFIVFEDEKLEEILLASSISQVILNLISNAKDALIAQEKEDKKITLSFSFEKEYIQIECCDSGDGVDKEISQKIFDPYFTTKPKTRGTGLGLYMSKQIVFTIFEGSIDVDSKRPSCFVVKIPFGKNCKMEKR